MMTGMDDRDDPECDLTLEAMAGLSKILAVVDESNVCHIFINICLRIRPCFEKVPTSFNCRGRLFDTRTIRPRSSVVRALN